MALDKIEIANYALILLGKTSDFCTSLEGKVLKDSERVMSKIIDKVINDCLIDILPNFAMKETTILPNSNKEIIKPADCLKFLSINHNDRYFNKWKIRGNKIIPLFLHLENKSVKVVYISNSEETLEFANDNFNKYCSYSLAVETSHALGQSNLRNTLYSEKEHVRCQLLSREDADNETAVIY